MKMNKRNKMDIFVAVAVVARSVACRDLIMVCRQDQLS